jgi:hypothetical protein
MLTTAHQAARLCGATVVPAANRSLVMPYSRVIQALHELAVSVAWCLPSECLLWVAAAWAAGLRPERSREGSGRLVITKPRNSSHFSSVGVRLLAGPQFAAAGDERAVAVDGLFGIDRLISHGGIDVLVAKINCAMCGSIPFIRIGGEDTSEVMGKEDQQLAAGIGEFGVRDYRALSWDKSDKISGIRVIGDTTAGQLDLWK